MWQWRWSNNKQIAKKREKQKCSNVLNLASIHFFSLVEAPLIANMARVAINKRRIRKKT
jgi:hypothetical protein